MQLRVKARVVKEIYHNDNFYILALSPMQENKDLVISQYGTFTCKGELSMLTVGQDYELVLEEINNDKYGISYKVIDVPSLNVDDLTDDDEMQILRQITTDSQAEYVHKAYPNFIRLIINGEEDKIDINKIYNVGVTRLNIYKRLINEKFRYYYLMKQTQPYEISMSDCKLLLNKYRTIEECVYRIESEPYYTLMEILGRTFEHIDKMILDVQPDLKVSEKRCEALIIGVLRRNEIDGSTRLYANDLFYYIKEEYDAKELLPMLKDVAVKSDLIYFDEKTKDLSIMSTYLAECRIAEFVKEKIRNSKKLDIDYTKYKNIDDFTMSDMQLNALKVFCESNVSVLAGNSGSGKSQPIDTIIPTPIGNRRLDDIKVGDYVFDRLGNPTKVLGVFPQGMKDCYTVTLRDGRKTQCNDEHLWSYYTSKGNLYTKTLRQMIDDGLYNYSNGHKMNKYKIPTNKAVEYPKRDFDVDPYVIGSFIGNGCCRERALTLSSGDEEQVAEVARLISAKSYKKSKCSYSWHFYTPNPHNYTIYYQTKEILWKYSNEICQLSGNKRIPNEYKYSSIEQRYSLLQGLFDTDGHISNEPPRFNVAYSTTSYGLAKDIQEVLFSLGYSCSLSIDKRPNKNDCYSINVLIPNKDKYKLFRLSRKKERALKAKQYKKHRIYDKISIVDVKKESYQKEMVCILVDNDEHLYLTNDYIVTHNTSSVKGLISLMEDNNLTYTLLSPTGKAARVLSESTGRKAYTIHKRCFSGDIDTDVIIVDECGMVSLDVFCMLLTSISNPNARIVFVGDPAQLSSIGLSKIFDDLIKSNIVPMTMLTEVFRYKSDGSLFVATNIRQGKNFFNDKEFVKYDENTLEYSVNNNYRFILTDDILNRTVTEYKKLLQKGIKKENILILSPFNVGLFGTYAINNEIQEMVNPAKPNEKVQTRNVNKTKIIFRTGDLVINTKNDYEAVKADNYYQCAEIEGASISDYNDYTTVVNGQTGVIRDVVDNGLIIQFDEDLIYVDKSKLNQLLLGYAISVHKSQGSTTDYSINIVSNAHKKMLTRGLLYVATTRCKKAHIDIGDINAFKYALTVDDNDLRQTWLLDLLTKNA